MIKEFVVTDDNGTCTYRFTSTGLVIEKGGVSYGDGSSVGTATSALLTIPAATLTGRLTCAEAKLTPVTFANLPASPAAGDIASITDASSITNGADAAGGSTHKSLVFYTGAKWIIVAGV